MVYLCKRSSSIQFKIGQSWSSLPVFSFIFKHHAWNLSRWCFINQLFPVKILESGKKHTYLISDYPFLITMRSIIIWQIQAISQKNIHSSAPFSHRISSWRHLGHMEGIKFIDRSNRKTMIRFSKEHYNVTSSVCKFFGSLWFLSFYFHFVRKNQSYV